MIRQELVERIWKDQEEKDGRKYYSYAECREMVDMVIEGMRKGIIRERELKLKMFGTFKVVHKNRRYHLLPDGTKTVIPDREVVKFFPSEQIFKEEG